MARADVVLGVQWPPPIVQRTVARTLNAAGVAAPVLWLATFVYIGSLRPDYSPYRQYISELAARGAPAQHLMQVAGFILPGLMVVAFGLLVGLSARTKLAGAGAALLIVSGIARIAAGVFPLDSCCAPMAPSFSERVHNGAGGLVIFAMGAAVGVLNLWVLVFAVVVWSRLNPDARQHELADSSATF